MGNADNGFSDGQVLEYMGVSGELIVSHNGIVYYPSTDGKFFLATQFGLVEAELLSLNTAVGLSSRLAAKT